MSNIGYLKIALSALIFGGALVFSYFTFFNSLPALSNSEKSAENIVNPLANVQNPIKWQTDKTGNQQNQNAVFSGSRFQQENDNFTKNFIQAVQEQVIKNQQGENFDPSQIQFSLGLVDSLKDSEIKISSDNSQEAKKNYLKLLEEITKKDYYVDFIKKEPASIIVSIYKDLDPLPAKEAAIVYSQAATDFSAIEVPGDWKDFHKKLIIYFKNGAVIYDAMAQYLQDPIKGYAALDKGKDILTNQGVEINKIWQKKYKEIQ